MIIINIGISSLNIQNMYLITVMVRYSIKLFKEQNSTKICPKLKVYWRMNIGKVLNETYQVLDFLRASY